ncbi:MAG: nickel insertion protein, partial [Desulfitobacterium hafniense]
MKAAYLDCFSGVSGDMLLGALVDAGLDFNLLQRDLAG